MPTINLGDNWQTAATAGSPGDTFTIAAGTHRLQSVTPQANQTFTCATLGTVVMSGAQILTGATVSGATWFYTGQTQAGAIQGVARTGQPRGAYPEDLFFDNIPLLHVATIGAVTNNTWFFDYVADRIYIGNNPSGHVVETSVTRAAFTCEGGPISGVTISNLVIEKYATLGNTGTINAPNSVSWTVTNCEVRLNHATGIFLSTSGIGTNNFSHHNGQSGAGCYNCTGVLWDSNEFSYNGAFFDPFWAASGYKMALVLNTTVSNNFAHHNYGGGLWSDFDCENIIYSGNRCEDNDQFGIFHEIGWACIIRNNVCQRNGFGAGGSSPAAGGIFVASSNDVEIYGNTVVDNYWAITAYEEDRGTSPNAGHIGVTYRAHNLNVHDNLIRQDGAAVTLGYSGMQSTVGSLPFTAFNNRWTHNTYYLGANASYFLWQGLIVNEISWQAYGNDTTGFFYRGTAPAATITGTVVNAMGEADVVAGGRTIVITLASGIFVN